MFTSSYYNLSCTCRFQWSRGLRRGPSAERLLGSWVRFSPGAWMFVSCECLCVVRYRSLRRTDHPSRGVLPSAVCLIDCDLETSKRRRPRPDLGCCATGKEKLYLYVSHTAIIHHTPTHQEGHFSFYVLQGAERHCVKTFLF
jgi:hypothetical protein